MAEAFLLFLYVRGLGDLRDAETATLKAMLTSEVSAHVPTGLARVENYLGRFWQSLPRCAPPASLRPKFSQFLSVVQEEVQVAAAAACAFGRQDVLDLLLAWDAAAVPLGSTPWDICSVCLENHVISRTHHRQGVSRRGTLMHWACAGGSVAVVERLVSLGCDINELDAVRGPPKQDRACHFGQHSPWASG